MDLFGRARKLIKDLGPTEPSAPEYYRVACPDGHLLRGQRTEGYQALRCPACSQGVFILPRSPLPEPPTPASERPKRSRVQEVVDESPIELTEAPSEVDPGAAEAPGPDIEIQWEDEPTPSPRPRPAPQRPASPERPAAPTEPVTPKARPARPQPTPAALVARGKPKAPATDPVTDEPDLVIADRPPPFRLGPWARRHPLALAVSAVLILALGTVWDVVRRNRLARLPEIANTDREEGLQNLEEGKFLLARRKLESAASALETLRDPDARSVRQAAREAAIFDDLVGASLEDIVERLAARPDGPSWFETLYKGRSILIEDTLPSEPGGGLSYLILAGRRRGRIDLEGFHLLDDKKPGDTVTFGARLQSVRLDNDEVWWITLVPDSGVYLTTDKASTAWRRMDPPEEVTP